MKMYTIQGKEVWLLTINELSKVTGIKSQTLRLWEGKSLLPKAAITDKIYSPLSKTYERRRLYTEKQAEVLAAWVGRVQPRSGLIIKQSLIDILQEEWNKVTVEFMASLGGKDGDEKSATAEAQEQRV